MRQEPLVEIDVLHNDVAHRETIHKAFGFQPLHELSIIFVLRSDVEVIFVFVAKHLLYLRSETYKVGIVIRCLFNSFLYLLWPLWIENTFLFWKLNS